MPNSLRTNDYTICAKLPETGEFLLVQGHTGAIDLAQNRVASFLRQDGRVTEKVTDGNAGVNKNTIDILMKR